MKYYFLVFWGVIFLSSCQSNLKQKAAEASADSIESLMDSIEDDDSITLEKPKNMLMAYTGILPCADCRGLQTELELYSDNTFVLKETYMGKGDGKPFVTNGKYNTVKGFEDDVDATLYVINFGKVDKERYFVRLSEKDELLMLDKDRKRIDSKLNYILSKR
ncbi:copper resistance protein NlpE [Solitalea lacus]|uniref:copper resistance protein NlpE n=1 Tax=Solitalea lacus TaxID=2911172 RepID=UPI001EDC1C69|nr:copper resistance protein NlpE [Solitalea lacus]UKJ06494.1 copper resistance protein NlpE [Solitalea lacus]